MTDSAETAAAATAAAAATITGNFRYITDNQSSAVRSTVTVSGAPHSTHPLARLSDPPQLTSRCPCQVSVTTISTVDKVQPQPLPETSRPQGFNKKSLCSFFIWAAPAVQQSTDSDKARKYFSSYVNSNIFSIDTGEFKALLPHQKCAKTHTRQSGIFKTSQKVSALRMDREGM